MRRVIFIWLRSQKSLPVKTSHAVAQILQLSRCCIGIVCVWRLSGAMYMGVQQQRDFSHCCTDDTLMRLSPMSHSFTSVKSDETRMFAGLMSAWTILFSCKYTRPCRDLVNMLLFVWVDSILVVASSLQSKRMSSRLFSRYSDTNPIPFGVTMYPMNRMILPWRKLAWIFTSFSIMLLTAFILLRAGIRHSLYATVLPFIWALYTVPKQPEPISSLLS